MYDLVFVTHLPSFYKCNLYNEIAKEKKVKVLFIGQSSVIRNSDFTVSNYHFDYVVLSDTSFESRSRFHSCFKLVKELLMTNYKQVAIGGWDLMEFWVIALLSPNKKNALCLESSINDSKVAGFRSLLKKLFLKLINRVYYSGKAHRALLDEFNYTNEMVKTLGVGIRNNNRNIKRPIGRKFLGNLLYVGRLSPEKGLEKLIKVIAELEGFSLTIVGSGPDELTLKEVSRGFDNIIFEGYVDNNRLPEVYSAHDIFVLPSISEPWGLVIEEALASGLPIICSNKVGCMQDLVLDTNLGLAYDIYDEGDLSKKLSYLKENYYEYSCRVSKYDFNALEEYQVEQYKK
ncbi:glycosyltransferase family 4 protein [Vibrio hepatarius]|uniref:glycosyltransferase family 4 protein n=1 Tax=Vibrio hepatarius TaxID=171383 RepID=UPI001C08845F|nr:glycosyltransferase family 4 protein [Vibrio hepatarius]MBU2896882.1 glycosyltransferase family 4 protein [Vibrio hepatarius]